MEPMLLNVFVDGLDPRTFQKFVAAAKLGEQSVNFRDLAVI